ncbi:hypothetical protein [Corynebacterium deserti]|nr:hypothetical protein [Corynebacterium deserti]
MASSNCHGVFSAISSGLIALDKPVSPGSSLAIAGFSWKSQDQAGYRRG